MTKSAIKYSLDGIDLTAFGIHISGSRGVLDLPSLKQPQAYDWSDYHGVIVDLEKPRYNTRSMIFDASVVTSGDAGTNESMLDFTQKVNAFCAAVSKSGLRQLLVFITPEKPLVFMVYMKDSMDVEKKWKDQQMYGKFQIKFEEPEPIKRIIKYTGSQASITFRSGDMFNIYWGDGKVDYDVSADTLKTVTHNYVSTGTYYICFSGNTDSLTEFSTNGTAIW